MKSAFLVGQKIYLRPFDASDLEGPYLDWLNDHEVTRFMETGQFPTTVEALQRYVQNAGQTPDRVLLAIVEKDTDTHIGTIKLGPIHWIHRRADLGIMIGDKQRWGRGYGREALDLVLAYGFGRLNLNKITLGVYADHIAAVKLYEGLGFKIEGTLRKQLFRDGEYCDKHVMGILRDEYEGRRTTER